MSELPLFLLEMAEQIRTQNNRMTADPIFCVCYDKKLPTDEDHADGHEWFDGESSEVIGDDESLIPYLKEYHHEFIEQFCCDEGIDIEDLTVDDFEWVDLPGDIRKVFYLKEKAFVKASLTEVGAQQFIDRKQHDYPPLYIYAESMCFQNQMIELRNWLLSLPQPPKESK